MYSFKTMYSAGLFRYGNQCDLYTKFLLRFFRKSQTCDAPLLFWCYKALFQILAHKHQLEIYSRCNIGKGLYLGHAYNITINGKAVIGDNCNLHKGVTIGQENRGVREGSPTIGNCVWIGINATIVGNIKIGDDVLIAPNSFVNKDIPSHSVVFGNPCVIKKVNNATEGYICNIA